MTKILYIPNGQYVTFISSFCYHTGGGLTVNYDYSDWYHTITLSPEAIIKYLCESNHCNDFKLRNNLPIDTKLVPEEFEIIKDD